MRDQMTIGNAQFFIVFYKVKFFCLFNYFSNVIPTLDYSYGLLIVIN